MSETPRILRPRPRRPFELPSNDSSQPPTPPSGEVQGSSNAADLLDVKSDLAARRTGSLLNLTSSTLLGIFQPTAFESGRDENSPWDTQIHTPIDGNLPPHRALDTRSPDQRAAVHRRTTTLTFYVPLISKMSLLFACGVVYGVIMAHLHENHQITPVKLELIDRNSYRYLGSWGVGGVALAFVLPWLDNLWENAKSTSSSKKLANGYQAAGKGTSSGTRSSRWTLAVRSIGAFVGIGFALV
ncbi:insulin-induced protein-domain-containing protein [Talaromyces proteolyticus]|uniref:Insulin-induced protein-domain-containing protein n=1 Tax=Talaromyces proteolyticus TaxID=1131652 RepID=A0AAD4PVL6_9EURO|nr:insulin-induced protein-domain-containing protein [Talaromyces proteolyticus]KAH8693652.1 insulin-induced protein-domain-containing protein [Talaromyces proteolyticus]